MTPHRAKTCLIIDRGADTRSSSGEFLDRHHFNVRQVSDGVQAMAVCRAAMPDIILLDSSMTKLGGLEFLRHLRRTTSGNRPVVLFCAAPEDARQVGAAIAQGASECLMKPYDSDLLNFKLKKSGAV